MNTTLTSEQVREMTGCLCFSLRRTTRAVTQFYDAALKPYGLRATQVPILVAANMPDALHMAPLAERLGMDRTTLLRNLRPLVRRKLMEINRATDSRRTEIRATRAGRALLAEVYRPWRRAQTRAQKILADPAWAGGLEILAAAVRDARG